MRHFNVRVGEIPIDLPRLFDSWGRGELEKIRFKFFRKEEHKYKIFNAEEMKVLDFES